MAIIFTFLVFSSFIFGQALAQMLLESRDPPSDVILKGEILNGVRVVLVTAHHTILYKENTSTIVPTADVARISTPKVTYP
jgi:hypothetical protein